MATTTTNLGLTKPAYADTADIAVINANMDKIDTAANGLEAGIAIVSNNNTHAAVSKGQYVYVRNHGTLSEGMYKANSNIAANGTLSGSNLAAVSGGLGADVASNADEITALNSNLNNIGSFNTAINENVSIGSSYASTGKTFTLTKTSIVSVSQSYSAALPLAIGVKGSSSNVSPSFIYVENSGQDDNVSGLWAHGVLGAGTYYVWAKAKGSGGSNGIRVDTYQIRA